MTSSPRYEPTEIEPHWQARWEELSMHRTDLDDTSKPKYYVLTMYDYPSGDLHIGHWFVKTPTDAIARFRRMKGYNVFFPVGFDAFGLPAENAAARMGVHPREWTLKNIDNMRRQLRSMGASWDWSAEVVTCEPDYYRWNQWFFLKFFERGLAYRRMAPVDWCPTDQVVLAREQVIGPNRVCWRDGTPVVKRDMEQWFFRTTAYADELLTYPDAHFTDAIRVMQTNWIGRSDGAEIAFAVAAADGGPTTEEIRVFTTRPDTLFGATFMVLAPEHPLVETLTQPDQKAEVDEYRFEARRKSEIDRLVDRAREDRRRAGFPRDQSDQRRADPDLDRRLRAAGLRHRRNHGRPGARRARLRLRPPLCAADPRGGRAARRTGTRPGRGVHRTHGGRGADQLGRFHRHGCAGGSARHHPPAGEGGSREVGRHLSAA